MPPATVAAVIGASGSFGLTDDCADHAGGQSQLVEVAAFADLAAAGATGCRSACRADPRLEFLGRAHMDEARRAIAAAQAFPPCQLRPYLRAAGPRACRLGARTCRCWFAPGIFRSIN